MFTSRQVIYFQNNNVGQLKEDSRNLSPYAFPDCVLGFTRSIVQGDIKGEIREAQKLIHFFIFFIFFPYQDMQPLL